MALREGQEQQIGHASLSGQRDACLLKVFECAPDRFPPEWSGGHDEKDPPNMWSKIIAHCPADSKRRCRSLWRPQVAQYCPRQLQKVSDPPFVPSCVLMLGASQS
eukprot:2590962-Rhodomonas_salina.1